MIWMNNSSCFYFAKKRAVNPKPIDIWKISINFSEIVLFFEFTMERPNANDGAEVRRILTQDWIFRKKVSWPLVTYESSEFPQICDEKAKLGGELHFADSHKPEAEDRHSSKNYLRNYFPHLDHILQKYKGNLVACGGAIMRSIRGPLFNPRRVGGSQIDVDLFFYNCDQPTATAILLDCVCYIASKVREHENLRTSEERMYLWTDAIPDNITIQHCVKTTNVIFSDTHFSVMYQFIHRIYPTMDSIIGGFDLGPSMLAYDGTNIYATPLGAWSITNNTIIVDTTRRSTSYEHRIQKYYCSYGFAVVFPGLKMNTKYTGLSDNEKYAKVYRLMDKLGVSFSERVQDRMIGYGYEAAFECGRGNEDVNFNDIRLRFSSIYTRKTVIKTSTPVEKLHKYSDYDGCELSRIKNIQKCNGSMLRTNNLERVCVQWVARVHDGIGMTYAGAAKIMEQMILKPEIEHDLGEYLDKMRNEYYQKRIMEKNGLSKNTRKNVNYFAEFLPKLRRFFEEGFQDALPKTEKNGRVYTHTVENVEMVKIDYFLNVTGLLNVRMLENAAKCQENLKGIKWITRNPQRQWTSSTNPIMADPRDFYGQKNYKPFLIGIPREVEASLRILKKRGNESLRLIPKDVMGLLFEELCLIW